MKLTFVSLQRYFPELNKEVISPRRVMEVFGEHAIEFYILGMDGRGSSATDTDTGQQYVFLSDTLRGVFYNETLAYETVHAFCHYPAKFMKWRHDLEAEFLALVMMMPATDLPRLNRVKHHLEAESYDLLVKRNRGKEIWKI